MTNAGAAYGGGMDVVHTAVTDLVEDIFSSLNRIGAATAALWDRLDGAVRSTDLAKLRQVILDELPGRAVPLHGAGLVLAPDALGDRPRHLEWWRSADRPGAAPDKVRFDLNPSSDYFYDYSAMEWFAIPRDRATRWVAGPYLDYTGVDLYICTFALPVHSEAGAFLGIAGADVTLAALDGKLMPALRAGGRPVALVNAEGRVIVGNNADHVTGSRLKKTAIDGGEPVPGTQWTLVDLSNG
ncbi:MAG: cache domain-containing protein [Mycobacterium sp.]